MVKLSLSAEMFLCTFVLVLITANICLAGDVAYGHKTLLVATLQISLIVNQMTYSLAMSPMAWAYYIYTSQLIHHNAELEQAKNRRGGTVGLFAFPRVGRSDPNLLNNWEYNPSSYEEYEDIPKLDIKRSGLVPFPRVGRSDSQLRRWSKMAALQQNMEKRTGASANSGLWFGPRLGRIQKRSTDNGQTSDDNHIVYTPRLGRDSEEILNDDDVEIILKSLVNI